MKRVSEEEQLKRAIRFFVINVLVFIALFAGGCLLIYTTTKISTADYKKNQFISQASLGEYETLNDLSDALAEKFIDTYLSDIKDDLILKGINDNSFEYAYEKLDSINYYIVRDGNEYWLEVACLNNNAMKSYHNSETDNYVTIGDWFIYGYTSKLDAMHTAEELSTTAKTKLDTINYDYSNCKVSWSYDNRVYILVKSNDDIKTYGEALEQYDLADFDIYIVQSVESYYMYDYAYRHTNESKVYYTDK